MIKLTNYKYYPYIVQIGSGGTGGYVLQQVSQILSSLGINKASQYIVADPDLVEQKNLNNQLFIKKDIGKSKAQVLSKRYGSHYQIPIHHYSESYVENVDIIHTLFNQAPYGNLYSYNSYLPILIGCVDNNFSRKIMNDYFMSAQDLIYIDAGISAAIVPQDNLNESEWTVEEKAKYANSGWSGQIVCGVKWKGEVIQEPLSGVCVDVLDEEDNEIRPSDMSCSDVIAIEPQRLITNRYAALAVSEYVNELLSEGTITNHVTFLALKHTHKLKALRSQVDKELKIF